MSSERLQKIISAAGVASRRQAETLILAGRVTVNGAGSSKRVVVQKRGVMFERVGDCFWIYKSKNAAKKDGVEKCITVKSLKLIKGKNQK